MEDARRAPSLHNGQHFHLVLDEADPRSATVVFERARGVPVGDATGRFLFVALGAMLDSLRIAVAALGHESHDELLCDQLRAPYDTPGETFPIARVRIDGSNDTPARARAAELRDAMRRRQTNRRRFDGAPVSPAVITELLARLEAARGVALSHTTDPSSVRWIVRHNCRVLFADLEDDDLRRELEGFIRFSRAETERSRDGLAAETFGFPGPLLRLFFKLHRVSGRWPIRPALLRVYEHASGGVPAIVWLRGPFSTTRDCVECGRALLELWLDLTERELAFQPFGSLITNVPMRDELLRHLGEPGPNGDGEVWLAARVGHGPPGPQSVRRSTADLIRSTGVSS